MNDSDVTLATSLVVMLIGFLGMAMRRSLLVVVMAGALSGLGGALALLVLGSGRGDAQGIAAAVVLLVAVAAWASMGAAVALTAWRRRGAQTVDDLTELRG
jgi:NADH:ubiquinone oxidoreductase subunit K